MKNIPIEFMPGFWVSLPEGIQHNGSGFLLAENIQSVFSIDCTIPKSQHPRRQWSILEITTNELDNIHYKNAIIKIVSETWIESQSIIIIGSKESIYTLLESYLQNIGRIIKKEDFMKVLYSKLE